MEANNHEVDIGQQKPRYLLQVLPRPATPVQASPETKRTYLVLNS